MWQRFSEGARKVVFYAQEEAQRFGGGYLATEHLLLAIARDPGCTAARILQGLGVTMTQIRAEFDKHLPDPETPSTRDMTLTPRAKWVIDLAYDEARNLNSNHIGTEHLLLGLIREEDGLAGRILARLGVELELARREAMALQRDVLAPGPVEKTSDRSQPYAWARYDEATQAALFRANGAAKALGETHLTPLHLALGILDAPDSVATEALKKAGVEPERLREAVERARTWAEGAPGFQMSPNGRQAIDAASMEAETLGSETLNTGHLLLGLVRGNPQGVGEILAELGVDLRGLRKAVREIDAEPPS